MRQNRQKISVSVAPEIRAALEAHAQATGHTMSRVLDAAVRAGLRLPAPSPVEPILLQPESQKVA